MFNGDIRALLIVDVLKVNELDLTFGKISYTKAKEFYARFDPNGDNDVAFKETCEMLRYVLEDGGYLYGAILKIEDKVISIATLAPIDKDSFLNDEDFFVPNDIRAKLRNKNVMLIQNVFTISQYRKIGIASELIKNIISENKEYVLMLDVKESNYVAKRIYESLGFVEAWKYQDYIVMFRF